MAAAVAEEAPSNEAKASDELLKAEEPSSEKAEAAEPAEGNSAEDSAAPAENGDLDKADSSQVATTAPKHELQHRWCLWVHQRAGSQKGGHWTATQQMAHEFGTVEDFWCMSH